MTYKVKVLAIDGGGIRGIIPAKILSEIEKRTGKQISELFDLIAGTSTGGILALGLTKPDPNNPNQPQYKADELVELYREHGQEIFPDQQPKFPWSIPPLDLFRPKFGDDGREKVLTQYLGNLPIQKALKEVFLTSYDTELRMPVFFTSNHKKERLGENYHKICTDLTMKQAAMATSAAPTFFPPYKVETVHPPDNQHYSLVDGGVFANNPASLAIMEAIIDAKKRGETIQLNEILLVSIGTGSLTRKYSYDQTKTWGKLQWMIPALDIVFDGASESVSCQLEQLLPTVGNSPKHYYRFQELLNGVHDDMDDASPENIKNLENLAEKIIVEKGADITELCKQLVQTTDVVMRDASLVR